ncbi:hypothetical protein C6A86_027765 [Mycobacterium sp. ITM-2016-00316]|nr:hypothetical protein [Mycobacterium sp. ITM-2016-00316]WNG81898.1 hypothetical protein C6A86_027765 [Mycobacterium sp. ITM-2016-00316]
MCHRDEDQFGVADVLDIVQQVLTGLQLSRPRDLLRLTSALTVAQVAALG